MFLALLLAAQTVVPPNGLELFVLAGQSNMSGRAGYTNVTFPEYSDIYNFGNDYQWHVAVEPIDSGVNQVDTVSKDTTAAMSPQLAFAIKYQQEHPGVKIGLIPCAKGSTSIAKWQRNLAYNTLYGNCLRRIRLAQEYGTVKGILFYQGEADAAIANSSWSSGFTQLVADWRADIGDLTLPVVFAQLAYTTDTVAYPYWEEIEQQQASISISNVSMITNDDAGLKDTVHLNGFSAYRCGERFATALGDIMSPPPICVCP
jgi:hypothetical protein